MLRRPNSLMNGSAQKLEGTSVKLAACDTEFWETADVAGETVLPIGTGTTWGWGDFSTAGDAIGMGTAGDAIAPILAPSAVGVGVTSTGDPSVSGN